MTLIHLPGYINTNLQLGDTVRNKIKIIADKEIFI